MHIASWVAMEALFVCANHTLLLTHTILGEYVCINENMYI